MSKKKTEKLYCNICKKQTKHDYAGEQKFQKVSYDLWTCQECGATRT